MYTEKIYIEGDWKIESLEVDRYVVQQIIEAKKNQVEYILQFTYEWEEFKISSNSINIMQ